MSKTTTLEKILTQIPYLNITSAKIALSYSGILSAKFAMGSFGLRLAVSYKIKFKDAN
jgi:hypothetical protein